jgi:putative MATE family efflux protein
MLVMGFGMMVGIGGASLISRQLGAGKTAEAERTLGNGLTVSLIVSVLVCIIVLPFLDFWLKLIGASEHVLPYARDYLIFIISGAFFSILSMGLLSFARAEGNARVGMTAMIFGAIAFIGLSALFIITFDMGVRGAGLATMIAQGVSMLYLLSYYLTKSSYLKISISNFVPDLQILKQMFAIGIAAFVQTVAGSISAMILINLVVSHGGDSALSAFGIVQRLMMFAMLPAITIGQGVQPVLGFNYGAKRYRLVLKAISIAAIASTSLSILLFMIVYFIPEPLIRIFTSDPELINLGAYASKLMLLAMPLMGGVMLGSQIFQAIGKATQAFIAAIVRPIVFLIPLVFVLSYLWELDGVLLAVPGSDLLTFFLIIVLLTPIIKQLRKDVSTKTHTDIKPVTPARILDRAESRVTD